MSSFAFNPFLLLFISLPLILMGVWRLKHGRWPARVGHDPHCRACEYSLVGLESNRCPECGAALTKSNIVHGQRNPQMATAWLGGFLILLGIVAFIPFGAMVKTGIQWIQFKPTAWLIKDVKGSSFFPAWQELKRRDANGSLSDAQIQSIIDIALPQQIASPTPPLASELVMFAANQYLAGKMSPAQKQRFFKQIFQPSLQTRPHIAQGDWVVYHLNERSGCPSSPWWISESIRAIKIDGQTIEDFSKSSGGGSAQSGIGSGGSMGSSVKFATLGKHELTALVRISFYNGPMGDPAQSQLINQEDRDLSTTFEIIATPQDIKLIDDPTLAPQIHAGITPQSFHYEASHVIGGEFKITFIPCDVAFDVIGRWDGKEHPIYSLTCNASNTNQNATYSFTSGVDAPPPPSIDLILRSSQKVAHGTVDQTTIWKGELIYPNLPVKIIAK